MSYRLDVSPAAQNEIKRLPGHIRQRMRRAINDLANSPRPPHSKRLDFELPSAEPRRLKIDDWRIIYAVIETDWQLIAVVGVRRRPPYAYADLPEVFDELT